MSLNETDQRRLLQIEAKLNEVQVALNNVAKISQLKSLLNIRQSEIVDLQDDVSQLQEAVGTTTAINTHNSDPTAHDDLNAYYKTDEFVSATTGIADAGKPIVLDSNGLLNASIGSASFDDHGNLNGILDDDHPQYLLTDGTRPLTGNFNLNGNASTNIGYAAFLTSGVTPPEQEGVLYWDDQDRTIKIHTEVTGVALQLGQELYLRATNKTGAQIDNGHIVYIDGAQGNRPTVSLANASDGNASSKTIGVATHNISDNTTGYITTFGLVRELNTTGIPQGEVWIEGDIIWLSAIDGEMTNVQPMAPNHSVHVGTIVSSHSTQGIIFVNILNGSELDDLHNVSIANPVPRQYLRYNGGFWINDYDTSRVLTKDTNYTIVTDDINAVFLTTAGAGAQVQYSLPVVPSEYVGIKYTFVSLSSNGIQLIANTGQVIHIPGSSSSSGGTVSTTATGSSITLVALSTTEWAAISLTGSPWTTA